MIIKLIKKQKENNSVRVWVEFELGNDSKKQIIEQDFVVSSQAQFLNELSSRASSLEVSNKLVGELKLGTIELPEEDIPVITPPTQAEAKKATYFSKLRALSSKKSYLDLGIITDEEFSLLRDEVKSLGKEIGEL